MAFARYQFTVTDEAGNVVPQAFVRVRAERPGLPLATIYSDRNGQDNIANPFQADGDGYAAFHVAGGAYQVEAFKGAFSRTWRYVGIGLASETDLNSFVPLGVWVNDFSYGISDLVFRNGYIFVSLVDENLDNEPPIEGSPAEPTTNEFWMFIPALQGVPGAGDLYDFCLYVQDRPRESEVIGRHIFTSEITFAEAMPLSKASSAVAATGSTVFSIRKNTSEFSTVTFGAGQDEGVFSTSAETVFAAGDLLEIVAPASRDATLADLSITLLGNR